MNHRRVRAVRNREWTELRQSKALLITGALLPLSILALIAGTEIWLARAPAASFEQSAQALGAAYAGLDPRAAVMVYLNEQYLFLMLFIPALMPQLLTTYSIVTEKEGRSLEPVLATPIATGELLLGKTLAAVLPAVVLSWLPYVLGAIATWIIAPKVVALQFVRPAWLISMALFVPLFGLLSGLLGVIISSRAKDARAAQAISALMVLPVVAVSLIALFGRILVSTNAQLLAALVLLVLDLLMLRLAVRLFHREQILTRWS